MNEKEDKKYDIIVFIVWALLILSGGFFTLYDMIRYGI